MTPASLAWTTERGRLIGVAYRMLGDFGLAEDVVSEVAIEALRHEQAGQTSVRSWPAFLTTVCVRRSIDRVRELARVREEYTGHWLPEPVATERLPEEAVADREMLSIALLHLAEQLAPEARAAVVLHRAFAMTAVEIGEILEKTPVAVRQLISRAERRLQVDAELEAPRSLTPEVVSRLLEAIAGGEVSKVVELLAPEAVLWADGGGLVRSALNPVFGADRIARFYIGVLHKTADTHSVASVSGSLIEINGEPAIALRLADRTDVLTFDVGADGLIRGVRQIANPEKLRHAFLA